MHNVQVRGWCSNYGKKMHKGVKLFPLTFIGTPQLFNVYIKVSTLYIFLKLLNIIARGGNLQIN